MPTTTNVEQVKLNIMTRAQYDAITPNANELYMVSDAAGLIYPELFEHLWFDYEISDICWANALNFTWLDATVYQNAYNHLTGDITGKTLQSETIAGTTIQFYLADDGHKICPDTEANNVEAIYAATGVAWYYIIDTTNQKFKLPRVNPNTQLVNTEYQGKKYLYFYMGTFTQSAVENTAGINATMFNNKVDVGHQVIAFQAPTAANNYTWCRKYADNWVEQGGLYTGGSQTIALPVTMTNTEYFYNVSFATGVTPAVGSIDIVVPTGANGTWEVKGMAQG